MKHRGLKRLSSRARVTALLQRAGLKEPIGELARFFSDPAERERWRVIRQDFHACKEEFRRITHNAPAGDPRKLAWIISTLPTVWGLKMEGLLSLALRLNNYFPVALQLSHNRWGQRYLKLFDIKQFVNFQKFFTSQPPRDSESDILEFVHGRPTVTDLLDLTYRKVDIGRVALSNVLNRHKFVKFDLAQPDTLAEVYVELVRAARNVYAAEQLVARHRPVMALLLEKGLSPMAEIFGVCVAQGIPVVQYVGSQSMNHFIFKRFTLENRQQHPFSLDPHTWEWVKNMSWSPALASKLTQDFEDGYKNGSWFSRKFLHRNKQIKSAETVRQQLGLDPSKKTAVIFSHVLWDATFFYGKGLFDDYETWLLETVRAACENPRLNWIVKLHPDLISKLIHEGYTGELRDIIAIRGSLGDLPGHVKLVLPDTDINTYSFFNVADFCLTVRGTIGIEMACYGVPVLTAGTGRYSGMGFTVDSVSKEEFLQRLAHIETTPSMSPEQIGLAQRFAYALFKLRPWRMESFEWVKMPIEKTGHPLSDNLVPRVDDFAQFAEASDVRELAEWLDSSKVDYCHPC